MPKKCLDAALYTRSCIYYSIFGNDIYKKDFFLEVLIPKTNIFEKEKLSCYEWEPTKSIPAKTKSATYKNLQTRKKQQQQQQAAANENPKN